ncbi:lytic transglycosylase domain-containing protein [Zestomonas carbonaria]|uniref:Membrane-bound lytic murein transglycosylase F n=1 Tax=Zestomonas carbonaria TaxID=2762745 RepID=A0A7U7ET63_9GAMM|nr:lytic transglycosylase domain-containing protein [Pseudomonas carbonaria]CAD5110611.1 Membrane-bound lytic murein transglycosylase F [Pseudomonas carbonaria]
MRKAAILLGSIALTAMQASADIYVSVAGDGTITLSNIPRAGRTYTQVFREPPMPRSPAESARQATLVAGAQPYAQEVAAAAAAHDLPEALLHAVIDTESRYDPNALSPKGAAGLMQLMPATAREMGVEDVWNPASNIRGGARYLKRLMRMFDDDLSLALAAYNAGPGTVRNLGRVIPPHPETQRYVPRVLERYQRLQGADL